MPYNPTRLFAGSCLALAVIGMTFAVQRDIIGDLVSYALTRLPAGWEIKMALILLPTLGYGLIYFGQGFPVTERIQHGVRTAEIYREALRPRFLLLVFCMLLIAFLPAVLIAIFGVVWIRDRVKGGHHIVQLGAGRSAH